MLYKYEMHVHDSLCSRCGHNPPEVIAKVYYDRGYAGMCFTNHFLQGSTAIDKTLPWEDKVRAYWNAYLRVKDWAKDKDFDILFGLEHHYGSGKEVTDIILLCTPELHTQLRRKTSGDFFSASNC